MRNVSHRFPTYTVLTWEQAAFHVRLLEDSASARRFTARQIIDGITSRKESWEVPCLRVWTVFEHLSHRKKKHWILELHEITVFFI